MRTVEFEDVNWHEAHSKNCRKNHNCCCKCCCCDACQKCCGNYSEKEIVYSYVFKQQIYYVKCVGGQKVNWIPLTIGDGTVFFDNITNSQYSPLVSNPLIGSIPYTNLVNQYPDYSKVDVGQGKQWPKKVFSPYVDSTAWPPYKLADMYTMTKVPYYNLGFIVSQNPKLCYPSWGGYYPAEAGPLNDQIKALRALGGDVTVSFGGAANVPLHVTAPNVDTLKEQYKRFIIAYGLTRIDFDLEGLWISASYDVANKRNSQALKMVQDELASIGKKIDIWFTLPILPTGLTGDGLRILQFALDAGVTISGVNAMTMDYGDGAAPDPAGRMGLYGIQAITSLKNQLNVLYKGKKSEAQLWEMIGTTPMIGVNDVEDEVFKQSDANQTLTFATSKNIGMISMWSANRDKSSESRIPQTDNEFSLIFNKYNT